MRKLFIIFAVTMLTASCYQEYDVPIPKEERDYLPAPTRAGIVLNINDSLMVLGPQLENPYTIATMEEARAQLLEENPDLNIPEITTSHYYVRFAPANHEELHTLLQDTTLHFYDFPLDREIFSGVYYHDPAIADSLPTYQYVSIPAEQWSREYANHEIAHEILESLCIPEDMDDFFDGDSNPGWGGGTITPIDPVDPWIPSPGTGEVGPLNTSLSQEDIIDMLVDRALSITGNLDSNSGTTTQSVANTNSSSNESWTPGGRITVYDDIVGSQIPLEGAKVLARRWFITHVGYTDANGNFTCNGTFKKPANYCIKWERAYWDIRDGVFGQAYYNGPKRQSSWQLSIGKNSNKSLRFATIHRAAHRLYYRNDTLTKPFLVKETIAYRHKAANRDLAGRYWLDLGGDLFPDIEVFGFSPDTGDEYNTRKIFQITSHELGHAAHYSNSMLNFIDAGLTGSLNFIESWAKCVEYVMTTIEYEQLGVVESLHIPWNSTINGNVINGYEPNSCNLQYWILPKRDKDLPMANDTYTSVFIDLIDDFNQNNYIYDRYSSFGGYMYPETFDRLPTDTLYYPLKLIESIVFNSASLNGVRNSLIGRLNPLTDNNINEKREAINNFFEQYQY